MTKRKADVAARLARADDIARDCVRHARMAHRFACNASMETSDAAVLAVIDRLAAWRRVR